MATSKLQYLERVLSISICLLFSSVFTASCGSILKYAAVSCCVVHSSVSDQTSPCAE